MFRYHKSIIRQAKVLITIALMTAQRKGRCTGIARNYVHTKQEEAMKAKKTLLKVKGLNWRRCDDSHKEILYREMICPFCEFRLMTRYEIEDCYDNLFKEART